MMESAHADLDSPDLRPIPPEARTWQWRSLASVWAGIVFCVPSYLLSCGMLEHGMGWWQAVLVVLAGNLVLWIPMVMIGHAGTRYGIAYPVLLRASFGTLGARLPVLLRTAVAVGWFGVQTSVGGFAIYHLLNLMLGGLLEGSALPLVGVSFWQLNCFLGFWLLQVWFLRRWGMDGVHKLAWYGAPALLAAGLLLVLWAWVQADGFASILSSTSRFADGQSMHGQAMDVFPPLLAQMVALWMLLAINIPDYTRYVRDQGQQLLGQFVGLPLGIAFFSLVGVTVPFATVDIFNAEEIAAATGAAAAAGAAAAVGISDPLEVIGLMGGFARVLGLLALVLAAFTTNLFAHLVPASTGLVALRPQQLDFSKAATVAACAALLLLPWRIVEWSGGTVFIWLAGLGAMLSPVVGILIADYFLLRRRQLDVAALYQHPGPYSYFRGWSLTALFALLVGNLLAVPGFLMSIDLATAWPQCCPTQTCEDMAAACGGLTVSPALENLYPYTPILGLLVGGLVYGLLRGVQGLFSRSGRGAAQPGVEQAAD
jgi:NCS1 family nucleobase:cation symporter-1